MASASEYGIEDRVVERSITMQIYTLTPEGFATIHC